MADSQIRPVQCEFHVRTPVGDGLFRYEHVSLDSPRFDGMLETFFPPVIGDLITLSDRQAGVGGAYRVVDRHWRNASYGSTNWPIQEPQPIVGPWLTVVVERDEDAIRNEAPEEDEHA